MWRDRTNLFISYRQSYAHHPQSRPRFNAASASGYGEPPSLPLSDERRGLMSAGAFEDDGDAVIEMDLLPPRWLDIQDEVTEQLAGIAQWTRKLDQLHQKHVLPGFEDEDDKRKEEKDIERLTQDITRKFHACQTAIKRIDGMVGESQQSGTLTREEETMARNLKISLASRVGDVSALFRKKQAAYLKKLRSMGGFASPLPGASTPLPQTPYTDPSILDSETDRSFAQSTSTQASQLRQQKQLSNPNDALIAQREREIEDIATGIIELANIFQELQTMVIDQGTLLDRIDYNVERMGEEVKGAEKELKIATTYQRRNTKRWIILLLIISIVGVLILLSLKLSSKDSGSSSPDKGSDSGTGKVAPPKDPAQGGGKGQGGSPDDGAPFIVLRRLLPENDALDRRKTAWRRRRRRGEAF